MGLSKHAPRAAASLLGVLAVLLLLVASASSDVSQSGTLRVRFDGKLAPHRLPRIGLAPVAVSLIGDISTTNHSTPPQLTTITMAINRHGRLNPTGLPRCHYHEIQPASTIEARRACRSSLVGSGSFRANVVLPDSSPFPSNGHVLAFNGVIGCAADEQRALSRSGRVWPSSSRTQGGRGGERASLPGRGSEVGTSPVIFSPPEREQRTGDRRQRDPSPSDRGHQRSIRWPRAGWGRGWPSGARTQGAALGGAKRKPEDAAMRSVPPASSSRAGSADRPRNAKCHRRPVIFAHIFGTKPVPISQLVVFHIHRVAGTYRVTLSAQLPRVAAAWGYISGLSLTLKRNFRYHGRTRSYLSAGCPAPAGIDIASYPFARASFGFDSGQTLHSRLTRTCKVRP